MSSTILVTGGAGFIGSHLCEKLLQRGHNVVCLDNFLTGKANNLAHLQTATRGKCIGVEGNVNSKPTVDSLFDQHKFDGIFHYAATVGVKRTAENPISVLQDAEGIRNILEAALANGKPKVVFASSSEVYGEPVEIPEREDGHINAQLPYAVVKLLGEKMIEAYWKQYALPGCALRFFNVYGPRQESSDYGFVAGIFIKRVLEGKAPLIFGDGTQTRDFVYIDDNIEAAIRAFESYATNGEVINVGTGKPTTILDLAEEIIDICGKTGVVKPEFVPARDDVKHRFPDVSKMRRLLNFRPAINLKQGLQKTIAWYKQRDRLYQEQNKTL